MKFTAELRFTGVGLAFLRSTKSEPVPRPATPDEVDLALIRAESPVHHPRLCFQVRDISRWTVGGQPNYDVDEMQVDGTCEAIHCVNFDEFSKLEIIAEPTPHRDETFDAKWVGRSPRPWEDPDAVDALDWLIQTQEDFGLEPSDLKDPKCNDANVYAAILKLPPGELRSERWLFDPDGTPARWYFDHYDGRIYPLAEMLVWRRRDLTGLRIRSLNTDGETNWEIHLDPVMKSLHGDGRGDLVQLSFSNLPQEGNSSRFAIPAHIDSFSQALVDENTPIPPLKRYPASESAVSSHGACPPGSCGC